MSEKPIPWRRFWARYFDFFFHAILIVLVWMLIDLESLNAINNNVLGFILMVAWILLDGSYMAIFGTTLGKKIMKIKIRMQNGSKVSTSVAYKRSRLVWLRGMGLGVGIFELIANIIGYAKLKKYGETSWDRDLGIDVTYEKVGVLRYLICPAFLICFIALTVYSIIDSASM